MARPPRLSARSLSAEPPLYIAHDDVLCDLVTSSLLSDVVTKFRIATD